MDETLSQRVDLRLTPHVVEWGRAACKAERRRHLTDLIRVALEEYLTRHHADVEPSIE